MKKVAIIGLGPEYNYPKDHKLWQSDNTKYASNHGASLIARTLISMFDAEYFDISEGAARLNETYEYCVIAFATHATVARDVTAYADFVEKLSVPVALFSLGIQDYSSRNEPIRPLHDSIKRILNKVISSTGIIGVRGFYTASLLYKNGYRDVVPVGCPTLYRNMVAKFEVPPVKSINKVVNVYHRTISNLGSELLNVDVILGQDFLDEVVFSDGYAQNPIRQRELELYNSTNNNAIEILAKKGYFTRDFSDWFDCIGSADFVIGPRLHGCVAAITQGIPALMIARDLRVEEIADFYSIPYITYDNYAGETIGELSQLADYTRFNRIYEARYKNFVKFLDDVGLTKYYQGEILNVESYYFDHLDLSRLYNTVLTDIANIERAIYYRNNSGIFYHLKSLINRVGSKLPFTRLGTSFYVNR